MKRAGFTMIELIFVIVILGILAAVAVPRMTATKSDAEGAKLAKNLATCITEAGGEYLANGTIKVDSKSCVDAKTCFTIETATSSMTVINNATAGGTAAVTDANGTVTAAVAGDVSGCATAQTTAVAAGNSIASTGTAVTFKF